MLIAREHRKEATMFKLKLLVVTGFILLLSLAGGSEAIADSA